MAHVTSGNVFEDLGFSREEAARLALQVYLSEQIRTFIRRQGLTQAKAAEFFDVPQPKISRIMNDKLQGFTIDYLVRMLARTGGTLNYSFRQPAVRNSSPIRKEPG
ncbi:MAG TPA: helix-turn-helix transcriptional regulator [Woeseiaceae bacterium]|nr:helix-turn-helix transcriptional regulator [Woeseiaceae bacterium]